MSMIKCKECGVEISSQAKTCPHCGVKLKKDWKFLKIAGLIVVAFIALGVIANNSKTENSGENISISNTQEKSTSSTQNINNEQALNTVSQTSNEQSQAENNYQAKLNVVYEIPNRYVLIQINGINPNIEIDKNATVALMKEKLKEYNVEQLQYIIYNGTAKYPDTPMRALGELNSNENANVLDFMDVDKMINYLKKIKENKNSTEKATKKEPTKEELAEFAEAILHLRWIGYYISPKELWQAYKDNEVVADEDFKGKPVTLDIKVKDGLKKDFTDSPYLAYNFDKYGLSGLHLEFDKKDPMLRQIKKGQKLRIKAYPKGFVMDSVRLKVSAVMKNK